MSSRVWGWEQQVRVSGRARRRPEVNRHYWKLETSLDILGHSTVFSIKIQRELWPSLHFEEIETGIWMLVHCIIWSAQVPFLRFYFGEQRTQPGWNFGCWKLHHIITIRVTDAAPGSGRLSGLAPVGRGAEMSATEHRCLTCGALILDNTTSTTACVKCARLRTRRLNFASPPHRSHKSSDRWVSGIFKRIEKPAQAGGVTDQS